VRVSVGYERRQSDCVLAMSADSERECWLGAETVRERVLAMSGDSERECWL
jgi:hypothetical protein